VKLHVVHDADGSIVAAVQEPDDTDAEETLVARPFPVVADQWAAQVEVDEDMRDTSLEDICTRFKVDRERRRLVPRDAQGY
jgi:hypothetical protein